MKGWVKSLVGSLLVGASFTFIGCTTDDGGESNPPPTGTLGVGGETTPAPASESGVERRFDDAMAGNPDDVVKKVDAAVRAALRPDQIAELEKFDWSALSKYDLVVNDNLRQALQAGVPVLDQLGIRPASIGLDLKLRPAADPPPNDCLSPEQNLARWGQRIAANVFLTGATCIVLTGPGPWCVAAMIAAVGWSILTGAHGTALDVVGAVMSEISETCCSGALGVSSASNGARCCTNGISSGIGFDENGNPVRQPTCTCMKGVWQCI